MPLFSNTEEIHNYIPAVNMSISATSLEKHIDRAAQNHIIPVISRGMYATIISTPATYPDVLELIKTSAVAFACFQFVNLNGIQLSDTGNLQVKTDGQTTARKEDIEAFKIQVMDIAYRALDDIAIFLEDHQDETIPIAGTPVLKYLAWVNSPQYSIFEKHFIRNADEFQTYVNIRLSRRVFLHLKPAISRVESLRLKPLLPMALIVALKATQTDPIRQYLVDSIIKPAIANLAFANGINELALITDQYDTTTQFDNTTANQTRSHKQAAETQIKNTQSEREADGTAFLNQIIPYLYENQSIFPEYTFPDPNQVHPQITQEDDWRFYAV
jgi:hypothetical protein